MLSEQERMLLKMEVRQFFRHKRSLHVLPLLALGVFLMAWIYPVGSPFAPIILVVIVGLELQFNNIFFRTHNELDAMSMFPLSWERIILVKNLATIVLALVVSMVAAMALLYFSPDVISADRLSNAVFYFITVLFPLLHFGNEQSVRRPRRASGLLVDDLVEAVSIIIVLFLLSIPAYIMMDLLRVPGVCLVYAAGTATYWYRVSIPHTATRIEAEQLALCSNG